MDKSIYKNRWFILIALVLIGVLILDTKGKREMELTNKSNVGNVSEKTQEIPRLEFDRKTEIEYAIRDRVEEGDYYEVHIDDVTINEDFGSDNEGYYIALVYLTFGVKNKEKTANVMMKKYSDDLVATLANQGIKDISEVAIFWKDKYNGRDCKYSYSYENGGFYIEDIME